MDRVEMSPEDKDLYIEILEDHLIAAANSALGPADAAQDIKPSRSNVLRLASSLRRDNQE